MNTEMGEFLVGAWLKEVRKCDFIQYNARLPEGHLPGLGEVDVIGLDLRNKIAYLCEVTTHLRGVLYGTYQKTLEKIQAKFERDKEFATKMLKDFPNRRYMLWSPNVPKGKLTSRLTELERKGIELVVNKNYARRIGELTKMAREKVNDTGNPAFRLLQILEHLRS
jgi:Holliday junction resolvase-like predicted endonuclease